MESSLGAGASASTGGSRLNGGETWSARPGYNAGRREPMTTLPTDEAEERDPLDLLAEQYVARRRRGERLDLEGFAAEHPEHADGIRAVFPTLLRLESIRPCRELWERGLHLALDAYAAHVFWEFREVRDGSAGQWARLARRLGIAAVPSLDDAMRELQLEPLHRPFRRIFANGLVRAVLAGAAAPAQLNELEARYAGFLEATAEATGVTGDPVALAAATRMRITRVFNSSTPVDDPIGRAALLAWLALSRIGDLAPGSDVAATSRAWYDELRLPGPLASGLRDAGLDEGEAWAVVDLVRVLLTLPRPSGLRGPARTVDGRLLEQWLGRDVVRTAIGLNTWQGVEYIDRDKFEAMLRWTVRLDSIDGTATTEATSSALVARLSAAAEAAGYRVDRLRVALAPPPARPAKPRVRPTKRPTGA